MAEELVYYPDSEIITEPLYRLDSLSEMPVSERYSLKCGGLSVPVYCTDYFSYAPIAMDPDQKGIDIEINVTGEFSNVKIRPSVLEIEPEINGSRISFHLDGIRKVSVELDGDLKSPLFILCTPRIAKPESAAYCFEKGNIYNAGTIELKSGDTVYIEEGAVVLGRIVAENADDITVTGNGILCGTPYHRPGINDWLFLVDLRHCRNVLIEGITEVDSPSWMLVPAGCEHVVIRNFSSLSVVVTGDGIDICGCRNMLVEDCFIRSADDCIALKSTRLVDHSTIFDLKDILIQQCVVWNAEPGNALEIGYELECREVSDITFRDCDVIHSEYEGNMGGAAMSIHQADYAQIHDIHYEDIRVEDVAQKLFDIKILECKYSMSSQKGNIRNIFFKNIKVLNGRFPVSQIRGNDRHGHEDGQTDWGAGECRPRNIYFDNIEVLGHRCTSVLDLHMVVELAHDIYIDGRHECIQNRF